VSLDSWENDGKMSLKLDRDVSKVVGKLQEQYPNTERKALRRIILAEHKEFTPRTVDRHLEKSFKNQTLVHPHGQLEHIFGQLCKIIDILYERPRGREPEAFEKMSLLITQLPSSIRNNMMVEEEHRRTWLKNYAKKGVSEYQEACRFYTRGLIDQLILLLYREGCFGESEKKRNERKKET
jgi:hypothetical protein